MENKEKFQPAKDWNLNQNKKNLRVSEGTKFFKQTQAVFKAFFGPPKSMLEVEVETCIMRSNQCWYISDWLKTNSIQRVRTGICRITGRRVGLYSTNPVYFSKEGGQDD